MMTADHLALERTHENNGSSRITIGENAGGGRSGGQTGRAPRRQAPPCRAPRVGPRTGGIPANPWQLSRKSELAETQ
jgi:hypothetical protein